MELQVRDSRDAFTQALEFKIRSSEVPDRVVKEYRGVLISIVTKVAVKLNCIGSEKDVRDRALPVATGMISIFLAHTSKGVNNPKKWAEVLDSEDLETLFRRGYTLVSDILEKRKMLGIDVLGSTDEKPLTFEVIEEFATHRANNLWAGYPYYLKQVSLYERGVIWMRFYNYLLRNHKGLEAIQKFAESDSTMQGERLSQDNMIRRALFGVLISGKPILDLTYKKASELVRKILKEKSWKAKAESNLENFLKDLPQSIQDAFRAESEDILSLSRELEYVYNNIRAIRKVGKKGANRGVDMVCIQTGLQPRSDRVLYI